MSEKIASQWSFCSYLIHWATALFLLLGLVFIFLQDELPIEAETAIFIHKSFGLSILFLTVLRLLVLRFSPRPPIPPQLTRIERVLYHTTHGLLYLTLLTYPVSGWLLSNAHGYEASWFGLALPRLIEANEALGEQLHEWHEGSVVVVYALVFLHVAGVLKELILRKTASVLSMIRR